MAMQHNYYPHSAGHDQRVRQIAERLRQDVRRGIESRDPLRAYHAAMKQQQRPEVN